MFMSATRRMKLFIALLGAYVAFANRSPLNFVIDLDREPGERWKEVAQTYGANVKVFLKHFQKMIENTSFEKSFLAMGQYLPKPYYDEVVGFAKYGNMSVTQAILFQFAFERTVTCTSVICVDDKNVIWHFWNFDYDITAFVKAITYNADFRKSNRSVYKATMGAGFVGVFTGVRPQGFSISINLRTLDDPMEMNLMSAQIQVKKTEHVWPVGILIRDLLERKGMDYKKAVNVLSTFPLMAPCYLAIAGQEKDEGIIIFRNREGVDSTRHLDRAKGRWFILVTNSDSKFKDLRFLHTFAALKLMTRQRVTPENMRYALMAAKQETTVTYTIMSAKFYIRNSTFPHF